ARVDFHRNAADVAESDPRHRASKRKVDVRLLSFLGGPQQIRRPRADPAGRDPSCAFPGCPQDPAGAARQRHARYPRRRRFAAGANSSGFEEEGVFRSIIGGAILSPPAKGRSVRGRLTDPPQIRAHPEASGRVVSEVVIRASKLTNAYRPVNTDLVVFADMELEVRRGERLALIGDSGVGKSTLLYLLSGLDSPTSGTISYNFREMAGLADTELADFRNREIGFVW